MSFNDRSSEIQGDGSKISIQPDGMVRFGSDANINVLFYNKQVDDPVLSQQCGRPMKVSKVYVRIQHPGERDYVDDPVVNKPGIEHRFAAQWEQFQKSQEQIPDGTPTEILFPQNLEIPANLHQFGIHTVEQLSAMSDTAAQSIGMGAVGWRNGAKAFLDKANAHVGFHQWNKEKAELQNKLEVQDNQIAQLKSQLDRVLAQLQGVPGAMVPGGGSTPPPMAQGHAGSLPTPRVDWTTPRVPRMAPAGPPIPVRAKMDWTAQYADSDTLHAPSELADIGGEEPGSVFDPYPTETPPQAPRRPRGRPRKTPDVA